MKKTIIMLMTVLMIAAGASSALAHPPSNLTLSWNPETEVLSVKADHKVSNPTQHYIMSIYITADGEAVYQQRYTKQASPDFYSDQITLKGLKKGAKVTAAIACNIMGVAEASIIIP